MIEYIVKVDTCGTKCWHLNGKLHREDGPAIEVVNGNKWWYLDGKLHRVDGPAIERADGTKEWYIGGKRLTETEFNNRFAKVVTIDGVQYKLTRIT